MPHDGLPTAVGGFQAQFCSVEACFEPVQTPGICSPKAVDSLPIIPNDADSAVYNPLHELQLRNRHVLGLIDHSQPILRREQPMHERQVDHVGEIYTGSGTRRLNSRVQHSPQCFLRNPFHRVVRVPRSRHEVELIRQPHQPFYGWVQGQHVSAFGVEQADDLPNALGGVRLDLCARQVVRSLPSPSHPYPPPCAAYGTQAKGMDGVGFDAGASKRLCEGVGNGAGEGTDDDLLLWCLLGSFG